MEDLQRIEIKIDKLLEEFNKYRQREYQRDLQQKENINSLIKALKDGNLVVDSIRIELDEGDAP